MEGKSSVYKSSKMCEPVTHKDAIHSSPGPRGSNISKLNANTCARHVPYHMLGRHQSESLCLKNRQHAIRHELAGLFAAGGDSINRDIHRIWGEVSFQFFFHNFE